MLFFLNLFALDSGGIWHHASLNSFFFITAFRSDTRSLLGVLSDFTVNQLEELSVGNVPVAKEVFPPAVIARGVTLTPDRPGPNSGTVWAKRMNPRVTVRPPPPQVCKIFVAQHFHSAALKSRFHKELIKFKENGHIILVSNISSSASTLQFSMLFSRMTKPNWATRAVAALLWIISPLLTGIWSCNNQQRDNR